MEGAAGFVEALRQFDQVAQGSQKNASRRLMSSNSKGSATMVTPRTDRRARDS